jgi:hypothetical protein
VNWAAHRAFSVLFTVELVCSLLRQRTQRAELKVHKHRGLFVCLLQCVPQGRDVFANYIGTVLQKFQ